MGSDHIVCCSQSVCICAGRMGGFSLGTSILWVWVPVRTRQGAGFCLHSLEVGLYCSRLAVRWESYQAVMFCALLAALSAMLAVAFPCSTQCTFALLRLLHRVVHAWTSQCACDIAGGQLFVESCMLVNIQQIQLDWNKHSSHLHISTGCSTANLIFRGLHQSSRMCSVS